MNDTASRGEAQDAVTYIKCRDRLIALIILGEYSGKGIHFFTPSEFSQQLAYMHHPRGKKIEPHIHRLAPREVLLTQEVLFIRKGRIRVDFYDNDRAYL